MIRERVPTKWRIGHRRWPSAARESTGCITASPCERSTGAQRQRSRGTSRVPRPQARGNGGSTPPKQGVITGTLPDRRGDITRSRECEPSRCGLPDHSLGSTDPRAKNVSAVTTTVCDKAAHRSRLLTESLGNVHRRSPRFVLSPCRIVTYDTRRWSAERPFFSG